MSDVNNPLRVSLAVHLFGKFFRESTTDMERELNEGIRKSVYQPLRSVYEIELEEVHSRKEEFIKVKQNWISKNEEYSRELKKENSKKMSSIEDLKATLSQLTHRLEDARTHLEKSVVNALTRMEGPVTDSLVESVPKLQKVFFDLSEIQPAEAKLPPLLNSYELVRRSKSMKEDVSKTPGEKTEEREAK